MSTHSFFRVNFCKPKAVRRDSIIKSMWSGVKNITTAAVIAIAPFTFSFANIAFNLSIFFSFYKIIFRYALLSQPCKNFCCQHGAGPINYPSGCNPFKNTSGPGIIPGEDKTFLIFQISFHHLDHFYQKHNLLHFQSYNLAFFVTSGGYAKFS